jgi:hypothetical protein
MIGECEALATALSLHRALEVQARACRNRARRQGEEGPKEEQQEHALRRSCVAPGSRKQDM